MLLLIIKYSELIINKQMNVHRIITKLLGDKNEIPLHSIRPRPRRELVVFITSRS